MSRVYLVGGAVRDTLLGRPVNDKDFVVVGSTPETLLEAGYEQVGSEFPVFLHPETRNEYALARTERTTGTKYKDFDCYFGPEVTIEQDLARRDLTINSMAWSPDTDVVDPFNGLEDLENRVLRHTSDAFVEDPVRVLRLYRFWAQLGPEWTIAPETLELVQSMVLDLTPERVWKEMKKALNSNNPELFFKCGYFYEYNAMKCTPQPKEHHPEGDVQIHTDLCMQQAVGDPEKVFAALCHDFGKPFVYYKYGSLLGHEASGVPIIESFCAKYKVPTKYRELATMTSEFHTKVHGALGRGTNKGLKPKTIMKLFEATKAIQKPARFLKFLEVCEADANGRGFKCEYPQKEYLFDCLQAAQAVDTKAISASMEQGKAIGEAIRVARIEAIRNVTK